MKYLPEKLKWWIFHPRLELIYLLGGTPNEHVDTLHYRNIAKVVANLRTTLQKAEYPPTPIPKPIPKQRKIRRKKCMNKEKVCYTREEAVEAMKHIKNPQIRIYCCEFCQTWHLTHKKRYDW